MHQVIERWNAAIADVLVRVDATLADARAGSQAVIAHIESDLTPLVQPWGAVEHQMHQYREQSAATDAAGLPGRPSRLCPRLRGAVIDLLGRLVVHRGQRCAAG